MKEKPIAPVRALTDDSGRFWFPPDMTDLALDGLPVRRAGVLFATAKGCGPDWVKTLQPKEAEWTLTLVRDVPIHGRLLDEQGQPLLGVTVRVRQLFVPDRGDLDDFLNFRPGGFLAPGYHYEKTLFWTLFVPGMVGHGVTDRDGRFRLEGLGGEA